MHVIILLAVHGHITIEQEEKFGIWNPFKILGKKNATKSEKSLVWDTKGRS